MWEYIYDVTFWACWVVGAAVLSYFAVVGLFVLCYAVLKTSIKMWIYNYGCGFKEGTTFWQKVSTNIQLAYNTFCFEIVNPSYKYTIICGYFYAPPFTVKETQERKCCGGSCNKKGSI